MVKTACFEARGLHDLDDPAVRDRAAHERHVAHPDQPNVGDILAATAQEAVVFLARERRANALRRGASECDCLDRCHRVRSWRGPAQAARASGRMATSASKYSPSRRQKSGRSMRSAMTLRVLVVSSHPAAALVGKHA